ncbi:metallophosphoesterase, partial [Streptomyces sp. CNQ085]|nr:metallophosphoesterase [Streptomyces sp. CNQ085]
MALVFVGVLVLVIAVLAAVHWYLWRRLVRDVAVRGTWYRRVGTSLLVLLPVTAVAAQSAGRADVPFVLKQILAWPGFLWLAMVLYLTLALLAGEAVRPLLRRFLERRDARRVAGGSAVGAGASGAPDNTAAPAAAAAATATATTEAGAGAGGGTPAGTVCT